MIELESEPVEFAGEFSFAKRFIAMDAGGRLLGRSLDGDGVLVSRSCGSPFAAFEDGNLLFAGQVGYKRVGQTLEFGLFIQKNDSLLFLPFVLDGERAEPDREDIWRTGGSLHCVRRSGNKFDLQGLVYLHGNVYPFGLPLKEAIEGGGVRLKPSFNGPSTANMIPFLGVSEKEIEQLGVATINRFPKFLHFGQNPKDWYSTRILSREDKEGARIPITVDLGTSERDGTSLGNVEAFFIAELEELGEFAWATVLLDPWKTEVRMLSFARSSIGLVAREIQFFQPSVAYFHRSKCTLVPLSRDFAAVVSPSESVFRGSGFELPPSGSLSFCMLDFGRKHGASDSSSEHPVIASVGHLDADSVFCTAARLISWGD